MIYIVVEIERVYRPFIGNEHECGVPTSQFWAGECHHFCGLRYCVCMNAPNIVAIANCQPPPPASLARSLLYYFASRHRVPSECETILEWNGRAIVYRWCANIVWWLWTRGDVSGDIDRIEDFIYVTYCSSSSEPTTTMRDRNRAETGPNESKTSSSSCHTWSMERCECFTQVLNGASKVQYLTLFSITLCVYSAV